MIRLFWILVISSNQINGIAYSNEAGLYVIKWYHFVVVDNASTDDSFKVMKNYSSDKIDVIRVASSGEDGSVII